MVHIPSDQHALVMFVVWYASKLGRSISRIRLIKFLYLADVHFFDQRRQVATGYRWKFFHYGPYAAEAQADIDECVDLHLIACDTRPGPDEVGDMWLYRASGSDPAIHERFSATLEMTLRTDIERWLDAPLNAFLDHVYFDTAPMREARRGQYLRFDETTFGGGEPRAAARSRTYASREARTAFHRFLESRKAEKTKVAVPRDAIVDDAFVEAVRILDAEDTLSGPIEGSVDVDPDVIA